MIVRQLGGSDAAELVRVVESGPSLQAHVDAEHKRWFVHDYLVPHLSEAGRVLTLGLFDGDVLRAFVETRRWTNSNRDVTLGTTAVDRTVLQPRARCSRWPRAIISLVNAVVGLHLGEGRDVVWTTRPDDAAWSPLIAAPDCVLSAYDAQVVAVISANTLYPEEFRQVSVRMPTDQRVVRMRPRGYADAYAPTSEQASTILPCCG